MVHSPRPVDQARDQTIPQQSPDCSTKAHGPGWRAIVAGLPDDWNCSAGRCAESAALTERRTTPLRRESAGGKTNNPGPKATCNASVYASHPRPASSMSRPLGKLNRSAGRSLVYRQAGCQLAACARTRNDTTPSGEKQHTNPVTSTRCGVEQESPKTKEKALRCWAGGTIPFGQRPQISWALQRIARAQDAQDAHEAPSSPRRRAGQREHQASDVMQRWSRSLTAGADCGVRPVLGPLISFTLAGRRSRSCSRLESTTTSSSTSTTTTTTKPPRSLSLLVGLFALLCSRCISAAAHSRCSTLLVFRVDSRPIVVPAPGRQPQRTAPACTSATQDTSHSTAHTLRSPIR
jgi:hypothetical protein